MLKPFGITIDEEVVFKVSLVLLSFLALLWIFLMVVILRLRKIQRRVDKATNMLTSRSIDSWCPISNAFAYSAEYINEDGKDSGKTSFECVEAKRENDEVLNVSTAEALFSSSEHSEPIPNGALSKHYISLKDPRNMKYEKLRDSEKTSQCLADTDDFVNSKYEAVTLPHNPSNQADIMEKGDYLLLIGDDNAQSTERHHVKPQHSGETSAIVMNNTVEGCTEAEADASQYDYENEYLAVIHSESTSSEHAKNVISPQENEYLMPIETAATEIPQGKYSSIHSVGNKIKGSQPADSSTTGNHGYLVTKETEKSAKNDRASGEHNPGAQCSGSETLKGSKENDDGYINIDQSSRDSRNQSSACSTGEKGGRLKRDDSVEEYSQYDYITVRQGKEQTVSSCNDSKPQEGNLSPGNATNPQKHNPTTCQEAHYINKDTAVYARDEKTEPSSEYSNEYLAVIRDEDFHARKKTAGGEAHSTTQTTGQDTGIGCSGDAPIYENPDFGNFGQ